MPEVISQKARSASTFHLFFLRITWHVFPSSCFLPLPPSLPPSFPSLPPLLPLHPFVPYFLQTRLHPPPSFPSSTSASSLLKGAFTNISKRVNPSTVGCRTCRSTKPSKASATLPPS